MRIGLGYDSHRFCEHRVLILGGVQVPHDFGLLGHSDADVLTHAVIDALLGAARLGDIGRLFPDTDEKYKNISSTILLKEAYSELRKSGFFVVNIDATIVAEAPKLSPLIPQMEQNLADCLGIAASQVSVKATTAEKMGFVGRGEGIAAHAICLIDKVMS
ncbi:MAG: 2-C-methyl-D-erythritol 2,4-cyclodiphosphate synthase [Clostridiales bacterium]|jgi:2-C-methyl-D-erythritol 2,4-cyclodiphosphate synthase|nr:2-C-methyl-D-erythritol 2,4-cyclodiphosphate synthase [Clostridiales bacterium]